MVLLFKQIKLSIWNKVTSSLYGFEVMRSLHNALITFRKEVLMTRNQLQYWENVERKRSNLANEKETRRSNKAREQENFRSNLANEAEQHRANVAREAEINRHNLVIELLTKQQNEEVNRHNLATESQNQANLAETIRSNLVKETQNLMNIDLGYANLGVAQQNADTNYLNARTNMTSVGEAIRHDQAMEGFNLLSLQESQRNNTLKASIEQSKTEEIARHNLAAEKQNEYLNSLEILKITKDNNLIHETSRHNKAVEVETQRHNAALETSQKFSNYSSGLRNLLNIRNDSKNADANMLRNITPFLKLLGGAS